MYMQPEIYGALNYAIDHMVAKQNSKSIAHIFELVYVLNFRETHVGINEIYKII